MLKPCEILLVDRAIYYAALRMIQNTEGSVWNQGWKIKFYLKETFGWKDEYVEKLYGWYGLDIDEMRVYDIEKI